MPHRRWIYATRAAAAVGLTVFAIFILAAPEDYRYSEFFNVWFYNGLMILACITAGSHAYLVKRDRAAWIAITAALGSWAFGEIWYAAFEPETYPSLTDAGFIGFYVLLYVGIVLLLRSRARSIGGTLWLDGVTASLTAAAVSAAVLVELVLESTEGSRSAVVTNLAYPLGDVLLFSAVFGVFSLSGWRPGHRWLLLGLGALATATRTASIYSSRPRGPTSRAPGSTSSGRPRCSWSPRAAWAQDRSRDGLEVEGRPLLAVPAVCALVATAILVYDHYVQVQCAGDRTGHGGPAPRDRPTRR